MLFQLELTRIATSLPTKAEAKDLEQFVLHSRVDDLNSTVSLKADQTVVTQNRIQIQERLEVECLL